MSWTTFFASPNTIIVLSMQNGSSPSHAYTAAIERLFTIIVLASYTATSFFAVVA